MRKTFMATIICAVALGAAGAAQSPPEPPAAPLPAPVPALQTPAVPVAPLPALPAQAPRPARPPRPPAPARPAAPARAPEAARGPEDTERFSRRLTLAKDGSVSVSNIAGEIVVTAGSGDEVSIDAVKRTRNGAGQLAAVQVDVEERAGRIDVRTEYSRDARNVSVSVDYAVTVPAWAAVELHSVSGGIRISDVRGPARAESVSGSITTSEVPKLEIAKSVSGNIDITKTTGSDDLDINSVSGAVSARSVKAASLSVTTVSGDVTLADVTSSRADARSISGRIDYSGPLARGGRYDLTSHSGSVRMAVGSGSGFELDAGTFSGSIRSEVPLLTTGIVRAQGARNSVTHATFGDGSAALVIRTFSGDIVISKP